MEISIVIPTHCPESTRLRRVLHALRGQSLPAHRWEVILVDNASQPPLSIEPFGHDFPANLRLIPEPVPGLSHARRRGFNAANAPVCVLVDDDNVLAPDYLAEALQFLNAHRHVGAVGGRVVPEFERAPAAWQREFFPLLALRDLGPAVKTSEGAREAGSGRTAYPDFAPIGAGMAIRRDLALHWCESSDFGAVSDRSGRELTSGGDNDLVFSVLKSGREVAYAPRLHLTHLIPAARLEKAYLGRLNRGIQKSWMQVLTRHQSNPWPAVARSSVPLRRIKAWFTHRAWKDPAAWVRWQGACGHFEGRVATIVDRRLRYGRDAATPNRVSVANGPMKKV